MSQDDWLSKYTKKNNNVKKWDIEYLRGRIMAEMEIRKITLF